MIWIKRLAWLLGAIVALVVIALIGVYVVTSVRMNKRYDVAARLVPVPADSAGIARGFHLALAIGKCLGCHGEDFGGTLLGDSFIFGRLAASNLTTGKGGVGPLYDDAMLARAIRHALRHDGTPLLVMPSEAFQYLSDDDAGALVGYIRSLPPVDPADPVDQVGPLARVLSLLTPLSADSSPGRGSRPGPSEVNAGGTVTGLWEIPRRCRWLPGCHGPGLSGGNLGPGKPASNLTAGRDRHLVRGRFRARPSRRKRPVGADIDSLSMPWPEAGR